MSDFGSPTGVGQEPERTSILALLSMVSSLICCIPGLSILGTFMGIGALISIGGSGGRVGGRGMAWTGVIVGILVSMLWLGVALGGASMWSSVKGMLQQIGEKFVAIESGDYDTARQVLTTEAAPELKQRARQAGATGWIVKPFDPVKLFKALQMVAG